MGAAASKSDQEAAGGLIIGRLPGIGEGTRKDKGTYRAPQNAKRSLPEDWEYIEVGLHTRSAPCRAERLLSSEPIITDGETVVQSCLAKLLLFNNMDPTAQRKTVAETFERQVLAGEILIKEGDTGLAASEMYIVKSGQFEVGGTEPASRLVFSEPGPVSEGLLPAAGPGTAARGQHAGEPEGARRLLRGGVAAVHDATLSDSGSNSGLCGLGGRERELPVQFLPQTLPSEWLVSWSSAHEKHLCRRHVKEMQENKTSEIEVFLNSVPLLSTLSREEKLKLASVLEEQAFKPEEKIVTEVIILMRAA